MQESFNTRFSSKIFVLKITFFFMFSHYTIKNSILRHKDLLEHMSFKYAIMHLCKHCSRLQKKCHVDNKTYHYIKCIHLDCKCNLTFSMMKWKRMKTEHDHVFHELLNIHKQMQKIITKVTYLQNQFVFLKNKKQTMIEWKF